MLNLEIRTGGRQDKSGLGLKDFSGRSEIHNRTGPGGNAVASAPDPMPEDGMPTLQETPEIRPLPIARPPCPIESGMRRLAASLTRTAAETAGAFFCSQAFPGSAWEAPRIAVKETLRCSQKNIGEKYELLCNLTADKAGYDTLFPEGVSDQLKMDAYCELANCICGSILADSAFSEEFGYLIPCVPCSGAARPAAGSRTVRGSLRLAGAWIHFSFAVQEAVPMLSAAARYSAAA